MGKNLALISFDDNYLEPWMVYDERNQKFLLLTKCSLLFVEKIYDLFLTNLVLFSIKLKICEQ
jgi:hypothetical protein